MKVIDLTRCLVSEVFRPSVAALVCSLTLAAVSQDTDSFKAKSTVGGFVCISSSKFGC